MKANWFGPLGIVCVALAAIVLLYVLSVGPVNALVERTGMGMDAARIFYGPLIWLHDHTPLREPLEFYVDLWSWR